MTQLLFSLNGSSSIIFVTGNSCGVIRKFIFIKIFTLQMLRLLSVCMSLDITLFSRDNEERHFRKRLGRDMGAALLRTTELLFVRIDL